MCLLEGLLERAVVLEVSCLAILLLVKVSYKARGEEEGGGGFVDSTLTRKQQVSLHTADWQIETERSANEVVKLDLMA